MLISQGGRLFLLACLILSLANTSRQDLEGIYTYVSETNDDVTFGGTLTSGDTAASEITQVLHFDKGFAFEMNSQAINDVKNQVWIQFSYIQEVTADNQALKQYSFIQTQWSEASLKHVGDDQQGYYSIARVLNFGTFSVEFDITFVEANQTLADGPHGPGDMKFDVLVTNFPYRYTNSTLNLVFGVSTFMNRTFDAANDQVVFGNQVVFDWMPTLACDGQSVPASVSYQENVTCDKVFFYVCEDQINSDLLTFSVNTNARAVLWDPGFSHITSQTVRV